MGKCVKHEGYARQTKGKVHIVSLLYLTCKKREECNLKVRKMFALIPEGVKPYVIYLVSF